mgnify:CR=1 FL=1
MVMVATVLAAVATLAVLVAIYAATTVRDPMAKRVKALPVTLSRYSASRPLRCRARLWKPAPGA